MRVLTKHELGKIVVLRSRTSFEFIEEEITYDRNNSGSPDPARNSRSHHPVDGEGQEKGEVRDLRRLVLGMRPSLSSQERLAFAIGQEIKNEVLLTSRVMGGSSNRDGLPYCFRVISMLFQDDLPCCFQPGNLSAQLASSGILYTLPPLHRCISCHRKAGIFP